MFQYNFTITIMVAVTFTDYNNSVYNREIDSKTTISEIHKQIQQYFDIEFWKYSLTYNENGQQIPLPVRKQILLFDQMMVVSTTVQDIIETGVPLMWQINLLEE